MKLWTEIQMAVRRLQIRALFALLDDEEKKEMLDRIRREVIGNERWEELFGR